MKDADILEPLGEDEAALADELAGAGRLVRLLDEQFRLPGTGLRIGLDGLLGLLPGGGDLLSAAASLYLIGRLSRLGLPFPLTLVMLGNVLIDTVIGAVPVLGDLFDIGWKSNRRNYRIALAYLTGKHPAIAPYLDRPDEER